MGLSKLIGCLWHSTGSHRKFVSWSSPRQDYMSIKNEICYDVYLVFYSYLVLFADSNGWPLLISCWIAILCMKQWQAVIIPLSLTSLMYGGSLVLKSLLLLDSWKDQWNHGDRISWDSVKDIAGKSINWMQSVSSNIMVWRNFIVVSILPCYHINLEWAIYLRLLRGFKWWIWYSMIESVGVFLMV